ncbi:MAG: hypothetical protein HN742_07205 [Lentisphaerae bacterium]|nr:hypothetical protein [Lentisphaerota bacterium]MBT4820602.1 hypothetical protein [Lentisphaerota bacterium]MBT5604518.1 hypothetical protein [Lentisphaerota bacterium]MBT7057674.1 hypothetical protein [Lentisphaerota bacterium]MBT7841641.1 hypothetical protein [Lentisphaerota bacterium]
MMMKPSLALPLVVCASSLALGADATTELPAAGSRAWISVFLECRGTLHTRHGRQPGGFIACANPECPRYNDSGRHGKYLAWDPARPDQWRCSECQTVFPSSRYPENRSEQVDGQRFEYHEDPAGKRHYFTPIARWAKAWHAIRLAGTLAGNGARGDKQAARSAADIVLAFADVYQHHIYNLHGSRIRKVGFPGRCNWGRFGIFGDYDWAPKFSEIYRKLDAAGILTTAQEQAYQEFIEHMLEQVSFVFTRQLQGRGNPIGQLWYGCITAARTFPNLAIHDLVHEEQIGEERILTAPDLIHECVEGIHGVNNLLANYFHADGLCYERTPAYHSMTVALLGRALDALEGYTDPPGYRPLDPGWKRFDSFTAPEMGTIARTRRIQDDLVLPNSRRMPICDSQHWITAASAGPSTSTLHHGWGLAALRCGAGPQSAVALVSCGSSTDGHTHLDHLNLLYYSLGQELVTDIGYPASADPVQKTWWRGSAASHNTVFVDGRNQRRSSKGDVVVFADTPTSQIVQMRDLGPYPTLTDYRRTVVLVGQPDDANAPRYLVDVFHVAGGSMHDYLLHAQAREDVSPAVLAVEGLRLQAAEASASLLDLTPGAREREGYEHITDLRTGQVTQPWEARWNAGGERNLVLRLIRLPQSSETVFVGQAPGHRKGSIRTNTRKLTKLICRRQGQENLRSAFTSVIEAHPNGQRQITGAARCETQGNEEGDVVAVEVTHDRGRDLIIVACEPGLVSVSGRGVALDGRVAVVSFDPDGALLHAVMVEARQLTVGGTRIDRAAPLSGNVLTHPGGVATSVLTEHNAVISVDMAVPQSAVGRMMRMQHRDGSRSTWTIEKVMPSDNGHCQITLDRPARLGIGRLGSVSDDGSVLTAVTGLEPRAQYSRTEDYAGLWLLIGDQWRRIVSRLDGDEARFVLDSPLPGPDSLVGVPFVVTRIGPGDSVTVLNVACWQRRAL